MNSIEYKSHNEIMATDIFISLSSKMDKASLDIKLSHIVDSLKDFEQRFSRFSDNNELAELNSSSSIQVSDDLYEMLKLSLYFYNKTNGFFDPSILPNILFEGYNISKTAGFYEPNKQSTLPKKEPFNSISLQDNNLVTKPIDLKIDLGGIGKSFIAKKLAENLSDEIDSYCINLGGDICVKGEDYVNKNKFWAINLELPNNNLEVLLTLTNMCIATSGTYKRKWNKGNITKNHIINPILGHSVSSEIVSCTVFSKDIVFADVYAKVFILFGLEQATEYCKINNVPAIFVNNENRVTINKLAEKYVWKNSQ